MDVKRIKNPVFIFNACVFIAFIILSVMSRHFSEDAQRYPNFIFGLGMVIIFIWMVLYFFFPKVIEFMEAQEEMEEGDSWNPGRYRLAWVYVVVSVLAGYLFGFIFLIPVGFIAYWVLLSDRKKLVQFSIIMVVTTATFYLVFDYVLHIPLLKGAILDLS